VKGVCLTILTLVCLSFVSTDLWGAERFPPPDFESGYQFPQTTAPAAQHNWFEYLDVGVLLLALIAVSYQVFRKRSRKGVFLLMVFSLVYFGFWRKGCICSIGAIGNVVLTIFDTQYAIPLVALLFFMLPLIFSLFYGRVFCAGVCPLGALQDLVLMRPVAVPRWLESALRLLAYAYLGAAILFAATGSAFVICRYDPFVAFFRLNGNANMVIVGICLLVIGVFVGRPYCRFLCPYGVLLRQFSRLSKRHVTITPDECINCRLCEQACPFGSIQGPTESWPGREYAWGRKRLVLLLVLLPILVGSGSVLGYLARPMLARVHNTVRLAERLALEEAGQVEGTTDETDAFRGSGKTIDTLYAEASMLRNQFGVGGGALGAFLGLVIGLKLIGVSVFRSRSEFEIDQANCVACARCYRSCPMDRQRIKQSKVLVGISSE
jgi:NosR/NirI family transcriptional regulator, nitrous oxide reductase regulator